MRIVICGAGLAGLTLGWRLGEGGHDVQLVEAARAARSGGYMIDFIDPGLGVLERLGLRAELERIHAPISSLQLVDDQGRAETSLSYATIRRRLFGGRHYNFLRGDLEAVLRERASAVASIAYGTSIARVEPRAKGVGVVLTSGITVDTDVLVGADGVHSRVRELVFDEEQRFARPLAYQTAAFFLEGTAGVEHPDAFTTLTARGRQVSVYPLADGRTATFWLHREVAAPPHTRAAKEAALRAAYAGLGWIVPDLLARLGEAEELYYDVVEQIEAPEWSRGRVVLLGDSAWCLSLLAGQGASMAVAGADVLGEELARSAGQPEAAFARFERRLRHAVERKQAAGRRMARFFVPQSRAGRWIRKVGVRLAASRLPAAWIRRQLATEAQPL